MSNMQINWEIGKKYKRRNGVISKMTGYYDSHFLGLESIRFEDGYPVWKANGKRSNPIESPEDIIEEVKENEMKIEVGKYYKARCGEKVYIVEELDSARNRTHLGIRHKPEQEMNAQRHLQYYYPTGKVYENQEDRLDLIEEWKEPKSGVAYLNCYPNSLDAICHPSREKADEDATSGRIACVRVEWKEGQFDD